MRRYSSAYWTISVRVATGGCYPARCEKAKHKIQRAIRRATSSGSRARPVLLRRRNCLTNSARNGEGRSSFQRRRSIWKVEYTDAPESEPTRPRSRHDQCPQCGTSCRRTRIMRPNANWVRIGNRKPRRAKRASGRGHAERHSRTRARLQRLRFLGLIFLSARWRVLLGALAATATAGFGLALIPIYWFGVMFHVYGIQDRVAPTVEATKAKNTSATRRAR